MKSRRTIYTPLAPAPIGAYSQGIVAQGLVFTAGQIPLNPETGKLVEGDFAERVDQVLHNLNAVLAAGGTDLSHAVKLTVFLTDLTRFPVVNEILAKRFEGFDPPARSVVEVPALPAGADIEIECVATV